MSNVYMPWDVLRHIHPRQSGMIVFGGPGGGAGYAEGGSVGPIVNQGNPTVQRRLDAPTEGGDAQAEEAPKITSTFPELAGQTFSSEEAKAMAEDRVKQQRINNKAASEKVTASLTDPASLVTKSDVATIDPNAPGTTIAEGTGQLGDMADVTAATVDTTATAKAPEDIKTSTIEAATTESAVGDVVKDTEAVQGTVSDEAQVTAVTKDPTTTDVATLEAAQGEAVLMDNPVQREIQDGEIITGAADAAKAAAFTEQIQAAQADPTEKATVRGQLGELMADFEGGATPAWAAGAMRGAMAAMAARGLSSSSMAGQAVIQAAMEAALPIATQDAQTFASFEMQNLSNRQQRAMLAAQQRAQFIGQEFDQAFQARVQNAARIADVANMNFTAEQQVALENSRAANTMNLANLSNRQATVMAQAAAISQLEMANLSNQQQAAVMNAQAFLQMDMANYDRQQQTNLFKTQAMIQSIMTDASAENAARQFNATSENQTKQFMANLRSQVDQFNTAQVNGMSQFNAGQTNAMAQFNQQIRNQREQFNAQNSLVIAQANAQWRQNVTTINTAAQNEANMQYAKDVNGLTSKTLDEIYQRERDIMSMAWKSSESNADRANAILLSQMAADERKEALEAQQKAAFWAALGDTGSRVFTSGWG